MKHILPLRGAILEAEDPSKDPPGEGGTPILKDHNLIIGTKITPIEGSKAIITPGGIPGIITPGVSKGTITQDIIIKEMITPEGTPETITRGEVPLDTLRGGNKEITKDIPDILITIIIQTRTSVTDIQLLENKT